VYRFPPAGEIPVGRHEASLAGPPWFSFEVPSTEWFIGPEPRSGVSYELFEPLLFKGDQPAGAAIGFSNPDRVYADPCRGILAPPFGPAAGDFAAALTTIPGVDATGPTDVTVGGFPALYVELTIRDDACGDGLVLWHDESVGPRRPAQRGDTIAVSIVDAGGMRVVIDAQSDPSNGPEVSREIQDIVDSVDFQEITLPTGELARGAFYFRALDSGASGFTFPADGWFASVDERGWVISRHLPPTADGEPVAAWMMSLLGPDVVYTDPCIQTVGLPVGDPSDFFAPRGANAAALVAALETVEGISVLSSSTDPYWPKTALGLAVPEDIGCEPEAYALWGNDGQAPRHPSAVPTRFRVWVLDLSGDRHIAGIHGSDRAFVEAELLPGAGPEIEQELQEIVDTISFPG
jgi:hypothetical protein